MNIQKSRRAKMSNLKKVVLLNLLTTACSTLCADRTDQWKIGKHTKYWCSWAEEKQTASRCARKQLLNDCPVTCDNCPSVTPAPVASSTPTSTPVASTPAPVPSTPSPISSTPGLTCPPGTANEGETQCLNVNYSIFAPKEECGNDGYPSLDTIATFEYNGDVLVELLGPSQQIDTAAIIIIAGHGGGLKPNYIPDRVTEDEIYCPDGCKVLNDSYTKEIALVLAQKVSQNYCKVPYVIINHLHRSKLDANREILEAAQENAIAEQAWLHFHNFIQNAQNFVQDAHGTVLNENGQTGIKGLLFDVHGYAGNDWKPAPGGDKSPFIQWGYRMSKDSLDPNQYCKLDSRSSGTIGTYTHARFMPDQSLECLVRGPNSMGSRVASMMNDGTSYFCGMGLQSQEYPSPKGLSEDLDACNNPPCHYYSGGFNVRVHEHLEWSDLSGNIMSTVQAELPRCIRFGPDGSTEARQESHANFAQILSIALCSFVNDLFQEDGLC